MKQVQKNGGRVFIYGEGQNTRSWVHISDAMQVYKYVIEAAANGGEGADWNENVRHSHFFPS
jgi:dTDP-D-glucose 4,6-dehydratase